MFGAVAIQVGLGLFSEDEDGLYLGPLSRLVSSDTSDKIRDLHELWFNVLLGLIVAARRRDHLLPLARQAPDQADDHRRSACSTPRLEPMKPGKWWVALICLAVGIGITRWIVAGAPPFGP